MFESVIPPGPELAAALAGLQLDTMNPLQRSDALSYVAEMESWLAGMRCRLLLDLGRDFDSRLGGGNAADEVMAACRISAWGAERLVRLAREAGRAPALLAALDDGRLGVTHAHRLASILQPLPDAEAAAVAAEVCAHPKLRLLSVGDVGRIAARGATKADPQAAATRRRQAAAQADVSMHPETDGMASLIAYGPAEQVAAAMGSVANRALAARRAGDTDTPIGVLRFHAAIDLLTNTRMLGPGFPSPASTFPPAAAGGGSPGSGGPSGAGAPGSGWPGNGSAGNGTSGGGPSNRSAGNGWTSGADAGGDDDGVTHPGQPWWPSTEHGGPAVIAHVTVPYLTLAGIQDAPAELAGYGPIPAEVARHLAARAGIWWRLLTDPDTGALCPTPVTGYRIPEQIRRYVLARDRTCSHPGCDRPAIACDLDHGQPWPDGPSCPCNLSPRCRRHHNAKTHHRWQVHPRLDGTHLTISPTGRSYPTAADPPPGPLPNTRQQQTAEDRPPSEHPGVSGEGHLLLDPLWDQPWHLPALLSSSDARERGGAFEDPAALDEAADPQFVDPTAGWDDATWARLLEPID